MRRSPPSGAAATPHARPRATRRSLPIALLRAREAVMQRFRTMLAAHDLTEQQWRVLRVLAEGGPRDASLLAAEAVVLPPSLTRILRALEARKLVTRKRDDGDGRRLVLAISARGEALIGEAAPASNAIHARLAREIGPERLERLLDELELIASLPAAGAEA